MTKKCCLPVFTKNTENNPNSLPISPEQSPAACLLSPEPVETPNTVTSLSAAYHAKTNAHTQLRGSKVPAAGLRTDAQACVITHTHSRCLKCLAKFKWHRLFWWEHHNTSLCSNNEVCQSAPIQVTEHSSPKFWKILLFDALTMLARVSPYRTSHACM